ncbi:MAG: ORF6N domain-containing protein [Bacteroidales bacterium]|nr:ORF6N domain-containing protein [Bacteroidales bacterium]
MENEIAILNADDLRSRIYMLRGEQVMMDFDLAQIYGYEVKVLNQQVKRNINRFPEDFMFQLTKDEIEILKSQFVTSRNGGFFEGQGGGVRKLPFAFTEQGVYMLATVLRGEVAEQQSIFVIDNYIDIKTLNLLKYKKDDVAVTLFTQNGNGKRGYLTAAEVGDFNAQYPALVIKPNPDCHDRFVITDYKTKNEKVYHCGASSKDAGNKVCAINVFENAALVYPFVDALLRQPDTIL